MMKHQFSAVNLLGVICAAVFLQQGDCLDQPRFQVTSVPPEVRHSANNPVVFTSLSCIPSITDLQNFQGRWFVKMSDGSCSNIPLSSSTDRRITTRDGPLVDTSLPKGTNIIIRNLSYLDNGTYCCEIQEIDMSGNQISEWASATVQLNLEIRLKPIDVNSTVRTFNDSQHIELGCDMSGYIRPQRDLFWIVNGVTLDPATTTIDGSKYRVSYRNGTDDAAQFGGSTPIPSVVTVLTILDVSLADTGVYSCVINNTGLVNDVNLEVAQASRPSGYPQNVKVIVDSSTSLSVSWNEVLESERNGNITHYDVLYTPVLMEQQPNKVLSTIGPVLAFTLKGLEEFTEYRVSVRAVTIVGSGPLSPSQTHRTEEDAPSAPPRDLVIVPVGKDSLQVSWEPPELRDINGVLRLYKVEYCIPIRGLGNTIMSDCVEFNVTGTENTAPLTSLKEGTTYSVFVAAFTVDFGPPAEGSAMTGETLLPLQPTSDNGATIAGIVIGVLLAAIALVLIASIVIGFIIRNKLSQRQHKQLPSSAVESQAASVVESGRAPSPNLLPVSTVIAENGTLDRDLVGEEITEPITSNVSLRKPVNVIAEEEREGEEHLDVINVQPKLELAELLKEEPPQYNLFDPAPPSETVTAAAADHNPAKESVQEEEESETAVVKLNFDDDDDDGGGGGDGGGAAAADSAEKDDIDSPLNIDGGQLGTDTKQELMELLENAMQ